MINTMFGRVLAVAVRAEAAKAGNSRKVRGFIARSLDSEERKDEGKTRT
jgi:hypothetical protein